MNEVMTSASDRLQNAIAEDKAKWDELGAAPDNNVYPEQNETGEWQTPVRNFFILDQMEILLDDSASSGEPMTDEDHQYFSLLISLIRD